MWRLCWEANGNHDMFVTKLAPDGGSLIYSTYIGGAGQDTGHAIALDDAEAAYVTGSGSDSAIEPFWCCAEWCTARRLAPRREAP